MSMAIDHLRVRILADLAELADYLQDHPHAEYADLSRDLLAVRRRLREHGHIEVKEAS